MLSGKYVDGIPAGSRGTLASYEWLRERLTDTGRNAAAAKLAPIAAELGCTLAQLALAWCLKNPHVSTVITGASRPGQVQENMQALQIVPRLDAELLTRMEAGCEGVTA